MAKLAWARFFLLTTFLLIPGAALAVENDAVFVSGNGDDLNDCLTPTSACRSLNAALSKVVKRGVIHVLPGDYAPMSITKAVEVIADEGNASIVNSAVACGGVFAGICVNVPSQDEVRIRGITIDQGNFGVELASIGFLSGAAVHVEYCTLVATNSRFSFQFAPSSGASELYMSDSRISGSQNASNAGGILIKPTGAASVTPSWTTST